MTYPKLPKAPIVEGLIDIRVQTGPDFKPERFQALREELRERYPTCLEARRLEAQLQFNLEQGPSPSQSMKADMVGYRFESLDKSYVFQSQVGGFTLSRLAPYESWEALRMEAGDLWTRYAKVAAPQAITRVAVRYINRVELPLPLRDFDDYLTAVPQIPPRLPQVISEFFARVAIVDQATGANIFLTQVLEPPNQSRNVLPLIMDIDVFKVEPLDATAGLHWDLLEKLRVLKNDAFFGSLTPKALELFQ